MNLGKTITTEAQRTQRRLMFLCRSGQKQKNYLCVLCASVVKKDIES